MRVSARVSKANFKKALDKAAASHNRAVTLATEAARVDTDPFVPRLSSALRLTAWSESIPSQGKLIYGSSAVPYAAAQYYGLPGKTWPGTVMNWFDVSKAANGLKWRQISAQEYRQHFGGG